MKCSTNVFQLKVLVDGRPVQEYHKDSKIFIDGRHGSDFELSLRNLTPRKLLVHPTVDGLSCMNGEEAVSSDSSQGYVLEGRQEINIPGWRLNYQKVAKFYFSGGDGSYADKMGKPQNKGVIGCAVWEEAPQNRTLLDGTVRRKLSFDNSSQPYIPPVATCGVTSAIYDSYSHGVTCGEKPSGPLIPDSGQVGEVYTQNLGTGFGTSASHRVVNTQFRSNTIEPLVTAVIYYNDYEGLCAMGIKMPPRGTATNSMPNPFPGCGCTPPLGWEG